MLLETLFIMTIEKVVLVGANGKLGPAILKALLFSNNFSVTILSRSSSKSTYPDSVHRQLISDDPTLEELVNALRGQDAIIVSFAGSISDLQIRLAEAAAMAGVKRFIPADFGSCDSSSERALELMTLYRIKQHVRQNLQHLSSHTNLTWTSLVCGHFFDYGLTSGLLQFDIATRKARIFDGGDIKWSTTTLETIATAVVKVLQKEEETKNRMLYIQSFCITQNEVLRSLERITGQNWEVEQRDSTTYIKALKETVEKFPDNAEAREELVSVVGIIDANWEGKENFANPLLELRTEPLDDIIKKVVMRQGITP